MDYCKSRLSRLGLNGDINNDIYDLGVDEIMHTELVNILGKETVDGIALILIGAFIMWVIVDIARGK